MDKDRLQAEFMDTVYREADRDDVDYYTDLAAAVDGPVLELGCGSGRIYLSLLADAVDVDGIDLSANSLAVLRDKADEQGLEPSVWQADMTDLSTDREYELVTCPFNAIQELTTVDQQQALFAAAYEALAPGGTFVFDTFVPDFEYIAGMWGEWQQRTIEFRGESVEFHTRSQLVGDVTQEYVSEKKAITQGGEELFSFEGRATLLPYQELEIHARLSAFDTWEVTGDYTDEPLRSDHSAQIWRLERSPAGA